MSSRLPNAEIEMDQSFNLLDTVIAAVNVPDHEILAGDLGTIVEIYSKPELAYEVEFVNSDGSTRALLTLAPEQCAAWPHELLLNLSRTARSLPIK